MNAFRKSLAALSLALAALPGAHALVVFDYSPSAHERFQPGSFPSAPVENPNFFLNNYDLSGVGWKTADTSFAVTLVSPQNFLAARHAAPAVGSSVSFLGQDGVLRTYTVGSITTLDFSPGVASDLVVGTLSAPVDTQISFYSSLYLGSDFSDYVGLPLGVYGAGGRMGLNSITGFVAADFIPQDGVTDNIFAAMHYDALTGGTPGAAAATQGQSGDSSSPSFTFVGGNLALLGVHSAIGGNPPDRTYDTFVPMYLNEIDAVLQESGYRMEYYTSTIPEPTTYTLGLALAAGAMVIVRRRRANSLASHA